MENKGAHKGKCSAKQKGGEMDVSDVILGVQGDRPYEYAYYEDNDDYDYEAAERDGETAGEDGHMSDKYKKSNHPYYSTESTEHAGQYLGGKWVYPEESSSWRYDSGNPVFVPSEFNKEVIWDRYHMSPEAFYAMYSDMTRDKVLLPEFQMAGETNVPTYHSPDPAIVTGKSSFGSPGWWGNKVAPWMDKAALVTGFVPIVGDAASLLFDVGANFARYQHDKNDTTLPEWQRKEIAKANLKSGLGLAGIGALIGLAGTSMPSGAIRKGLRQANVFKWTDSQWDDAYNKAIKSGNITEAQRLRDLHFKVSAPDTKIITESGMPLKTYHTSHDSFNSFKQSLDNEYDGFGVGNYFSNSIVNRGPIKYETYLNSTNPYIAKYKQDLPTIDGKSVRFNNIDNEYLLRNHSGVFGLDGNEITIYDPKNIKSADAITYDDLGNIIPLSKRDNFNVNDIRYGLVPPALLIGTGAAAYNRFNKDKKEYALGGPTENYFGPGGGVDKIKSIQKEQEEQAVKYMPLDTPFVFAENQPEGFLPVGYGEEGARPMMIIDEPAVVTGKAGYGTKAYYDARPNKYNPYLPLEQQSKEAQADYMAQHTREATAKAAPYVAGTLLATAALPYAVSSGIGLAKGIGDFGSFLATTAGRQAAANTGKRLLFDTALGMGAWNASNDVSQDITGKSLDSHISKGMQYIGVPEGAADVASSFLNPFGYLGAGAMEGAAKTLPYMIDRTKNVLSKTWNNPDSKFLHNVFPSRAIKLLAKEYDNTQELYKSIAETQKNAREKLHELDESLRYKTSNLESDEERGILFKQLYHADSGRNLKFEERVPIEKNLKGTKEEPLSYTDLNGNEIKANAVLHTGNGELKTESTGFFVKDGKIQNEKINTITTTDDRMNYFEPSSNDVQKAIYKDYQKISSDMGENGVVGGSYALYSHGITGSPHDLEVYTTQSNLKNLEKSLGLNHISTGRMVENYTSKYAENNPAHNVQVCIIEGNGKTSWGHNAESIYASLHPEEYFKLRESYSFNKLGKRITGDLKIEIPMSPEQLLKEMKNNPDALVKKVFIDNIVSGKGKHAQRIYEAALSQPKLMNECISTINKSMFGRDFQIGELYPSIDLTDIEANKELLNLIGYDEKYATDPEVMESVFRLFDTEATWGTAGAKEISDKRWGNQIINSATSKYNGAGAGANMARSPIGGGEQYAGNGLMTIRRFLLSHESDKINNVSDYLKQLKRLNAASEEPVSNILTTKQIETFNNFMTRHNMPNYIGTLTKDNTAQQMFVKINNIQSELNNKFGDYDAASNELMSLYRELDLPFLYDASERNNYRTTRHIGLNKDILSGGYFGGLSRPIAYGTKNSALYRPSERLEESQLRMENAHVYDVMDIFNPKTSTSSYGDMPIDDQLKSILENKIKNAEDAVRKDYTQFLKKDVQIYPYYMTQEVLPSQKAREIGKTIENEYFPLELESRDLRRQLSSLSDKLQDNYNRRWVLEVNRNSNRSVLGFASGVSFGAAALIGGIYGLINYVNKNIEETAQRNQKEAIQKKNWLKHLGIPFENFRDVNTELHARYIKYNEGRLRGKWKPFPEWAEENSDLVNDILTKYRK